MDNNSVQIEVIISGVALAGAGIGAWITAMVKIAKIGENVQQLFDRMEKVELKDNVLSDTSHRIEERLTTIEAEIRNLTEMVRGNLVLRDIVVRLEERIKNISQ